MVTLRLTAVALAFGMAMSPPPRHLRIVGLEFGAQEPMIKFTGEVETGANGEKAAIFETFTPVRIGLAAEDTASAKGLAKGTILYCKVRDDVSVAKDATGQEIQVHQEALECHE